jgi:hypothetical protein
MCAHQVNFFRLWTDICIEYHDRQNPGPPQHLSYTIVDAFSLFIVLLVKAFSDPTTKILLLQVLTDRPQSISSSVMTLLPSFPPSLLFRGPDVDRRASSTA